MEAIPGGGGVLTLSPVRELLAGAVLRRLGLLHHGLALVERRGPAGCAVPDVPLAVGREPDTAPLPGAHAVAELGRLAHRGTGAPGCDLVIGPLGHVHEPASLGDLLHHHGERGRYRVLEVTPADPANLGGGLPWHRVAALPGLLPRRVDALAEPFPDGVPLLRVR